MKKCVKTILTLGVVMMLALTPVSVFAEETGEATGGDSAAETTKPENGVGNGETSGGKETGSETKPETYNQTGKEGGEYDANDGDDLGYRDDAEAGASENIGEPAIPQETPRKNETAQNSAAASTSNAARAIRQVARAEVVKTEEVAEEVAGVTEVEMEEPETEATEEENAEDVHNMYINTQDAAEENAEKARTMAHFATAAVVVFAGGVGAAYVALNRKQMVIKEVKKPAKTIKSKKK